MGCDIHLYMEYRNKERAATPNADAWERRWSDFGGRLNPGRNYRVFESLAGVRGEESKAVAAPRGVPIDAASEAWGDYTVYITKEADDEDMCTPEKAKQWSGYGSVLLGEDRMPITKESEELSSFDTDAGTTVAANAKWVTHPDWHSHSWLTTDEYATAIRRCSKPSDEPEYYAVLAAMRQFEASGHEARVVFWFDN